MRAEHDHVKTIQKKPASQAAQALDSVYLLGHAGARAAAGAVAGGEPFGRALLMPASFVRLSISALIATMSVLPDIDIAATSGLSTNG